MRANCRSRSKSYFDYTPVFDYLRMRYAGRKTCHSRFQEYLHDYFRVRLCPQIPHTRIFHVVIYIFCVIINITTYTTRENKSSSEFYMQIYHEKKKKKQQQQSVLMYIVHMTYGYCALSGLVYSNTAVRVITRLTLQSDRLCYT